MSALIWGALGFFLFVLVAGTVVVGVLALGAWRQLRSLRAAGAASLNELTEALTILETRVERTGRGNEELRRAAHRLSVSLRRARVLLAAAREVRLSVRRVTSLLPQK